MFVYTKKQTKTTTALKKNGCDTQKKLCKTKTKTNKKLLQKKQNKTQITIKNNKQNKTSKPQK